MVALNAGVCSATASEGRVERSAVLLGIKMKRRSDELRPGRSAKLRISPMYGTEGAQGVR